ncbi:hypothetical protein HB771_28960 [Rhizobium leguminosarum bv. viciae]|nr:hypothetical protein HB771_28960 [Rhizobium leguminosarum bv. viciae]
MRKALVVWGGWQGHEPEQCADIVADLLREDDFAVEVTGDLGVFGSPTLAKTDLLVPIITGETLEKPHAAALGRSGARRAWACRPSRRTRHVLQGKRPFPLCLRRHRVAHPGNIIDFRVAVTRQDDPVMEGIPDFDYRSEQYYLHYDPTVEILATTTFTGAYDPVARNVVMPVVFKRHFGAGRIFYSALGHVAAEFDHPYMPLILRRGLSWAARQ